MKLPLRETLIAASCTAILIGLGTWQVQRLHWKDAVIARLQTAYAQGDTSPVLNATQLDTLAGTPGLLSYGRARGRLLRDKAVLVGPRSEDGRIGYHLLIPLETSTGHDLIVNAGWVSDLWKDNTEERLGLLPQEPVELRGLMRLPDWSSFTSKNSPSNDLWFRPDVMDIAKAKNLPAVYPFILYADAATPELPDVKLHEKGWLPRNKHLQYALFWYALAIVMLGVYGFYLHGLNKKKAL